MEQPRRTPDAPEFRARAVELARLTSAEQAGSRRLLSAVAVGKEARPILKKAAALFATIKVDLPQRQPWPTRAAAQLAIVEHLEIWHTRRRRPSTLA